MSGPSNQPRRGHVPRASLDTNASGLSLGGSALSFSGFSHRFPAPPSSVPASPVYSLFPSPVSPHPRRLPPPPIPQASRTGSTSQLRDDSSLRNISPYDWHEGASSIDVDATEHSLLSTSFITSLLRENPDSTARGRQRASLASDFSEMTYPPARLPASVRAPPPQQRPQGARPPPSSFQPIPESAVPVSDDDDTLYSVHDPVDRAASISRPLRGAPVASTTLRNAKSGASPTPSYGIKQEIDMEYTPHISLPYSPALPSTAGTQRRFLPESAPEVRQSTHSNRSRVPSFISVSSRSLRKMLAWRKKPLPPVPKIAHIPVAEEAEFRQKEDATSLSQLLLRSDRLRTALDNGQHPHHSFNSKAPGLMSSFDEPSIVPPMPRTSHHPSDWTHGPSSPQIKAETTYNATLKKRRIWIILGSFLVVAIVAIGAAVGVILHNRSAKGTGTSCVGNLAGAACNLDATCVCTSLIASRCDGLAQNLVNLVPTMNRLFSTDFSTHDVYLWIWTAQGTVSAKNCAAQATLVDVGAAVALTNFSNRTQWAQSALLWDLQSLNNTALRDFVVNAPWKLLTVDGPADVANASQFTAVASGYQYNFAAQTITAPPVSFLTDGTPTSTEAAEVSSAVPLDRMYSFAAAASVQYQGLLQSYWVTNLQRTLDKLPLFLASLRSAPILIPFDVETGTVRSLLASSTSFPPPIACYPNLVASQLQQINALESVFGLSPTASSSTQFSTSCFPSRPVYGVLDILRLRLPFADSRTKVARQAVALKADVGPRAVIYSGEILSAFPGTPNISTQGPSSDPNTYGTLGHFNHVVLRYLSSMPTLVASAVVDFVLSNSTSPPSASSILSTTTLPILEVAVFGTITKPDIDFVASGFADAIGGLVFGSPEGSTLRQWAIPLTGELVWTEFSNSSLVIHDTTFTDDIFNRTWAAAAAALADGAAVGVFNITNAFQQFGKFSS
ncbi:hypothetical protein B0H15DRAFT_812188 [Mycena belliarum]|uniref:Uncharacterized protein n=1 Tax=Mycena belliarum TaxID=1033014 RepID=A0AAD6ULY0_9AGAR|nr:hypothetical protein B0H15DRAFT_812188 [Mycena belliae]